MALSHCLYQAKPASRTMKIAAFLIAGFVLLGRASGTQLKDELGYPLHDAAIAAGYAIGSNRMTLDTVRPVLECLDEDGKDRVEAFEAAIPDIIDKATRKASTDVGRIVEYGDQAFTAGDNYLLEQRAVTVACVVDRPPIVERPTAAYAGHLLVDITSSTDDFVPSDPDPTAYNVTMIIEADVMELERVGMLYMPKRYCLDLEDENAVGVGPGGESYIPIKAQVSLQRLIQVGTRTVLSRSTMNRIGWVDTQDGGANSEVVRRAYAQPKAELVALLDSPTADCEELRENLPLFVECYKGVARETFLEANGFAADDSALDNAFIQLGLMLGDLTDEWYETKYALLGAKDPSSFATPDLAREAEAIRKRIRGQIPVAPFTFERNVASEDKNSPFQSVTLVNPFKTQGELDSLFDDALEDSSSDLAQCVDESGATTAQLSVATGMVGSLTRRSNEGFGTPRDSPRAWSGYGAVSLVDNSVDVFLGLPDDPLLDQTVSWKPASPNGFELAEGNLTNRIAGRTAKWLLVTPWAQSEDLQNILEAQRGSNVYSEVATGAVDIENPCGQTATQGDLVLFALAMILAAFGAVESVTAHVRRMLLWWSKDSFKYGFRSYRRATAEPRTLPVSETQDYGEDSLALRGCVAIWGVLAFCGLYVPIIIQIIREKEIADFETNQVGMEVNYVDAVININSAGAKSAMVTFVHSTSRCEDNYFWVLVWMLVAGATLGVCMNAHAFIQAIPCFILLPRGDAASAQFDEDDDISDGSMKDALVSESSEADERNSKSVDQDVTDWAEDESEDATPPRLPPEESMANFTQATGTSNETGDPPGDVQRGGSIIRSSV